MKTVLIVTGVAVALGGAYYLYQRRPKAVININDATGAGTFSLGKKQGIFNNTLSQGGLQTWNGFQFDVMGKKKDANSQGGYLLRRWGKVIEQTDDISPYSGGSSNVTVNHIG